MSGRRGLTLQERRVLSDQLAGAAGPVRHCWVTGPEEDPGPWPGLLLEWRQGSAEWLGLVVYVISSEADVTTVQTWVPSSHLRPVGSR
jgi:hypothetical protein